MTASGRGSRSDSFERQEGFALPGESVRLRRPVRSRGVAGAPAERGAPHAVGAGGKAFPLPEGGSLGFKTGELSSLPASSFTSQRRYGHYFVLHND
jgi:hypothetical protein